jgi:NTP pyrophosphatase (non-canonical NTP hydrolase)
VLVVNTDGLDIVHEPVARTEIVNRVKSTLENDGVQLLLPEMERAFAQQGPLNPGRRLPDFQRFHRALDRDKGFIADLFFNYIGLTEEVGELGRVLKRMWRRQEQLLAQVGNRQEAHDRAIAADGANLEEELADALAYLLKLANDAGIDLESAYLKKMSQNRERTW